MEEFNDGNWGIRINEKHYSKFDIDAPDWAKTEPGLSWYSKGVVIWDESQKIVISLDFWYSMAWLEWLKNNSEWEKLGSDVQKESIHISIEIPDRRRKGSSKSNLEELPSKSEKVITKYHLSPEQTKTAIKFLQHHEKIIHMEGEMIKWRYEQSMESLAVMICENMMRADNEGEKER